MSEVKKSGRRKYPPELRVVHRVYSLVNKVEFDEIEKLSEKLGYPNIHNFCKSVLLDSLQEKYGVKILQAGYRKA